MFRETDLEELIKTSSSLMSKSLLDRFTRDEVLDLLSFLALTRGQQERLAVMEAMARTTRAKVFEMSPSTGAELLGSERVAT